MIAEIIVAFALYLIREAVKDMWPTQRTVLIILNILIIVVAVLTIASALLRGFVQ